jgi:lipoate---protein ligase
MLCLFSESTKASFNLALEEYLLNHFKEDVFLLYINEPSVIIGKHQIPAVESNLLYLFRHNIPLYRRLSGGGTVYHDLGNLNYTFIKRTQGFAQTSFLEFGNVIIQFLTTIGVEAIQTKRNSLEVQGKKLSGTAEHIYKNGVLHHGTLLINTDLNRLATALSANSERYTHKAVASVRSNVINLQELISEKVETKEFGMRLFQFILSYQEGNTIYQMTNEDLQGINEILLAKYEQWQWNHAYAPTYSFHYQSKKGNANFTVKNGLIENFSLSISSLSDEENQILKSKLHNQPHTPEHISAILVTSGFEISQQNEIIQHIF